MKNYIFSLIVALTLAFVMVSVFILSYIILCNFASTIILSF